MSDDDAWLEATKMPMRRARGDAKGVEELDETAMVDIARYLFDRPGKRILRRPATGGATTMPQPQADELAAFREALGRPTLAGDVVKKKKTTHAKIETDSGHSFGSSCGGTKTEFREFLDDLIPPGANIDPIAGNHAEAHALYEAWNRGILKAGSKNLKLYSDRDLCGNCAGSKGIKRIMAALGIDEITVYSPKGVIKMAAEAF